MTDEKLLTKINEAIEAGQDAQMRLRQIQVTLRSAKGWGIYDLLGGGLISGMMKRIRMEKAQQQIEELRGSLERFNRELKDVQVQCSASAELSAWLNITDLVLDDPLSDWLSLSEIKDAKAEIDRTEKEVTALLARLESSRERLRQS